MNSKLMQYMAISLAFTTAPVFVFIVWPQQITMPFRKIKEKKINKNK